MSRYQPFFLSLIMGLAATAGILISSTAEAGMWDLSAGFNYNRSEYAGGSFSTTRRLGGSLGYNFTDASTIELAYQRSFERNHYAGFEDSKYTDQVFSLNMVWNLLARDSAVQPYLKVGVGQLIRNAQISLSTGQGQNQSLSQVTGVLGAGIKFRLTRGFGLRMEGTSYLVNGKFNTWKKNFGATFGISYYF